MNLGVLGQFGDLDLGVVFSGKLVKLYGNFEQIMPQFHENLIKLRMHEGVWRENGNWFVIFQLDFIKKTPFAF